jgi:hypothetical protein
MVSKKANIADKLKMEVLDAFKGRWAVRGYNS